MSKDEKTPQYIKQVPWYAQDQEGKGELIKIPTYEPKGFLEDWYDRGKSGPQSTTYRKGACENCGAMGHNKKQCTERPRKIAAKFTKAAIAPDDIVKNIDMNWQVKRDRWNGYQPEMYAEVIEEYRQFQQFRKKVKTEQEDDGQHKKVDDPLELANLPTKHLKNQKFLGLGGVRNREDKAKYLLNLDLNSANFDPKSRILEGQDDYLNQLNNLDVLGEKADLTAQDRFAFEQVEKHHAELNSTALPTLTEKIYKNVKQKMAGINSGKMGEIMKKYGVEDNNKNTSIDIVYQEDEYQDFTAKPLKKIVVRSRYEEDVFNNDHTTVWGSWYNEYLGWGYKCCNSNEKWSYCTGAKGRERALGRQLKAKAQRFKEEKKLQILTQQEVKDQ